MPIFEYMCESCGNRFEELVFGDSGKIACPKCGSHNTRKQLSTFAASNGSSSPAPGCGQAGCNQGYT